MTNITRRTFVRGAPASALVAVAVPAAARAMPSTDVEAKVVALAYEIMELLREHAPEGSVVRGFSFTGLDNQIRPDSIWASAITEDYRLVHLRPGVRRDWFPDIGSQVANVRIPQLRLEN